MPISRAFATVLLIGPLLAPSLSYSEVEAYPDTPNVIVYEIGTNWIRIQSIGEFSDNTDMNQVHELAEYTCRFWDRQAVVMSQSQSSPDHKLMMAGIPQTITFYFLVACAIP